MDSTERHEIRYQRRKAKREQKKREANAAYDDFDKVFTFRHLYNAKIDCTTNGTGWKESHQKYRLNACVNVTDAYDKLHESDGKIKLRKPKTFFLWERGHKREVNSVHIAEQVIQKCMCKYSLKPIYQRTFIYDNSASLKGGGTNKARKRMICHLERFVRKHGTNGWIAIFDFSNYFGNADHAALNADMDNNVTDRRIKNVANAFTTINNPGAIGTDLGSEQSQIQMVGLPNQIDHMIKEKLRVEGFERYMDDGDMIDESKEFLQECLKAVEEACRKRGIILNQKKTRIVSLKHGFQFLKRKYKINPETGKIIVRLCRDSIVRERRRLKKYRGLVDDGRLTLPKVKNMYDSWRGSIQRRKKRGKRKASRIKKINSFRTIQSMDRLYNQLFVFTDDWKVYEQYVQSY